MTFDKGDIQTIKNIENHNEKDLAVNENLPTSNDGHDPKIIHRKCKLGWVLAILYFYLSFLLTIHV